MGRRYRLLSVHLVALLLPCAVIGLLGYKWLRLERDAEARRSREAAEAEAGRIRQDLSNHLALVAGELAPRFARAAIAPPARQRSEQQGRGKQRPYVWVQPPFAPPPQAPGVVASAYLFRPDGKLLYPDYEAAYHQAIREYQSAGARPEWQSAMARAEALEARGNNAEAQRALGEFLAAADAPSLRAAALLHLGRLSLAARQYRTAESHAARILECCAAARDEYGVSFAFYAAVQIAAAWEAQGKNRAGFPKLASQLGEALRQGTLGYPRDVSEISALIKRAGNEPAASVLLRQAEQAAARTRRHIATAKRLEKWLAGSERQGDRRKPATFSFSTFWADGRPAVAGVYRTGDSGLLAVLFATDRLAAWVVARATEQGHFDAALLPEGENQGSVTLRAPLFSEAPGLDLVLRARETDPILQQRRQALFAGALAAAVLLIMLAGYFALRDVSRELQLASLRSGFVAGVTHELKTPLTSIRLLAETLRLKRTRDPAVAGQLLDAITDESERLTRLIDNVLSFSRIERGVVAYQPARVNLPEAVHAAVQRFQYILAQSGFELRQETDGGALYVYADAEALNQALLNLLGNAVKYSGPSREIRLGIYHRGEQAEVRVTDFGIGIPPGEQQRIFDGFYRVPEAARETAGAGLGLALVRHFAEAHSGRVTVSSEPGKGSTFSLWLPLMVESGCAESGTIRNRQPAIREPWPRS